MTKSKDKIDNLEAIETTIEIEKIDEKKKEIYVYVGETIKKSGYVFTTGSFIEEKYIEEIKNKEEFKEDIKNFLTLDKYAARKGGN